MTSILAELTALLDALGIPTETGTFKAEAPDTYVVIVPLADTFDTYADNRPLREIQEARISLFSKQNYRACANRIVKALLDVGITITDRRYLGHEEESGYHHFVVDTATNYELEEGG
jgi:hypothetical protein